MCNWRYAGMFSRDVWRASVNTGQPSLLLARIQSAGEICILNSLIFPGRTGTPADRALASNQSALMDTCWLQWTGLFNGSVAAPPAALAQARQVGVNVCQSNLIAHTSENLPTSWTAFRQELASSYTYIYIYFFSNFLSCSSSITAASCCWSGLCVCCTWLQLLTTSCRIISHGYFLTFYNVFTLHRSIGMILPYGHC